MQNSKGKIQESDDERRGYRDGEGEATRERESETGGLEGGFANNKFVAKNTKRPDVH